MDGPQDEKPHDEKSPLDILSKDMMLVQFCLLYNQSLVQFISLFTPPITSWIAYFASHFCIFYTVLHTISAFVSLWFQYSHIFYPEKDDVNVSTMRLKSWIWKIGLTAFSILLNYLVPLEDVPLTFEIFSKGNSYER